MVLGLKEIQILGEIRTNVDYTIDLLNVRMPIHYVIPRWISYPVFLMYCFYRLQNIETIKFILAGWIVE